MIVYDLYQANKAMLIPDLVVDDLNHVNRVSVPWVNDNIQLEAKDLAQSALATTITLVQQHNIIIYDLSQENSLPINALWNWWEQEYYDVGLVTEALSVLGYVETSYEGQGSIDSAVEDDSEIEQQAPDDGYITQSYDVDGDIALEYEGTGEI